MTLPHFIVTRKARGLIEVMVVLCSIVLLTGLALQMYSVSIVKSRVAGVLSHGAMIKELMMHEYYETGEWSGRDPKVFDYSSDYGVVSSVEYMKGGFTFKVELQGEESLLTIRAARSKHSADAPLVWLCGYDVVPAGYRAFVENRTTIPGMYLPRVCKGEV